MRPATLAHCVSALLLVGAIAAWLATGREGYTRWPDAKLAQSDAPTSEAEDALLADIGFETAEQDATDAEIESRFAFGLLPGGFDAGHLPSLVTAAVAALVVSSGALTLSMIGRRAPLSQNPTHS